MSENRVAISRQEQAIAAWAAGAKTRTFVAHPLSAPPGVSGSYSPELDRILLYPVMPGVDPRAVALEEAGHSRERAVYLRHKTALARWGMSGPPERAVPGAHLWLQWLEDFRVYRNMAQEFPGFAPRLRSVWEHRLRSTFDVFTQTPDNLKPGVAVACDIVRRYLAGEPGPQTFAAVIREAEAYLKGVGIGEIPPMPVPPVPGDATSDTTDGTDGTEPGEQGEPGQPTDPSAEPGDATGHAPNDTGDDADDSKNGVMPEGVALVTQDAFRRQLAEARVPDLSVLESPIHEWRKKAVHLSEWEGRT